VFLVNRTQKGLVDSKSKKKDPVKEKKGDLERKDEHKNEEHCEPQHAAEEGASPKLQQKRMKSILMSEPGSSSSM
jgi:hypothetical protein